MPIPQIDAAIARTTAKERIYKTIQEWVVYGTLLPGERLNDMELANFFHVSRTPVREALQMLAEEKLLNVIPSSGTFVAEINMDDMKHVYFLLGELQGVALDICLDTLDETDIAGLEKINRAFLTSSSDHEIVDIVAADRKFHHRIAELSQNPYLINFTDQLLLHSCRSEIRFFTFEHTAEESYQTHCQIIAAIRSRNLEQAKALLKSNWIDSLEKQMQLSDQAAT